MEINRASWPHFLDLLDEQPQQAGAEFDQFTRRILHVSPPKVMKSVPEDERSDLVQEIILHCIEDDFRVLRQYENKGSPFAAWFYFIARNKILDWIKRARRGIQTVDTPSSVEWSSPGPAPPNLGDTPERTTEINEVLRKVNRCLEKVGEYCQLLLRLAGDELVPREMVRVLGWPAEKAKKVSNDLGYCRKKLADLLSLEGVNLGDYV